MVGKVGALLPALIPSSLIIMLHLWQKSLPFTTEKFDKEYDYIVGKLTAFAFSPGLC
jgi:hypothetical protein